jgi:chitin disaccharide deacetylase
MWEMATRGIVLTADDYGIAPGVGQAIRELLGRGRLSAVSCMVVWPDFAGEGSLLRPYLDRADVGLHLTLTHDRSLGRLMFDAFSRRLQRTAIAAEVDRQARVFERVMGRHPAFIDGHHHVHLLPVVRDAVADAAARLGAYVRLLDEPLFDIVRGHGPAGKAAFLSLLSRPLARAATRRGVARNRGFRGLRSFAEAEPYRHIFLRAINDAPAETIVICHPGLVDRVLRARDRVSDSREEEFHYLASKEFPADLTGAGLHLARLRDASAP